jgi:hypothetical protein
MPDTTDTTATGPPIYVCGDSHTLPLVWNTVTVGGQQRMLVPALVTGTFS